jgi:hypothetical protein
MVKFKRKTESPVISSNDGVEHPGLILALTHFIADLKNNYVRMRFSYYHDETALSGDSNELETSIFNIDQISLKFTLKTAISFDAIMNLLTFDSSGTSFSNQTSVVNWFLNQPDPLDNTKLLGDDWEGLI